MTLTCTSLDGDAITTINGKTYGIVGMPADSAVHGYADVTQIMIDPSGVNPPVSAFVMRAGSDCKAGVRKAMGYGP